MFRQRFKKLTLTIKSVYPIVDDKVAGIATTRKGRVVQFVTDKELQVKAGETLRVLRAEGSPNMVRILAVEADMSRVTDKPYLTTAKVEQFGGVYAVDMEHYYGTANHHGVEYIRVLKVDASDISEEYAEFCDPEESQIEFWENTVRDFGARLLLWHSENNEEVAHATV